MHPLGNLFDIIPSIVPVDTQTGANAGDYISLKNASGVTFVFFKAAGTANDDPVITLRQATAVAGTAVKDLVAIRDVYKKQGAAINAVGTWTKVTQTISATFTGDATSAEEQALYVFSVDASQLDRNNGFDCIVANLADTGAAGAQLGCSLAILHGLRYQGAPESMASSIVD